MEQCLDRVVTRPTHTFMVRASADAFPSAMLMDKPGCEYMCAVNIHSYAKTLET